MPKTIEQHLRETEPGEAQSGLVPEFMRHGRITVPSMQHSALALAIGAWLGRVDGGQIIRTRVSR